MKERIDRTDSTDKTESRPAGPELSDRLKAVASLVTPGNTLADIGTDHAYIPAALVLQGIVPNAVAMDVGKGPLERAKQTVERYGLADRISLRLSDGLTMLKEKEAQTIVIAGMGGALTVRILADSDMKTLEKSAPEELILQPQSELFLVRGFLRQHGWEIQDEDMVLEDGKYYPMMQARRAQSVEETGAAEPDDPNLQKIWDLYGPVLLRKKHPVLMQYLQWEYGVFQSIENQLKNASGEAVEKRRSEVAEKQMYNRRALQMMQ